MIPCNATSDDCVPVMVTRLQLKEISKNILRQPKFDLVSTVNYVIDYFSKQKGCKVEVVVNYE